MAAVGDAGAVAEGDFGAGGGAAALQGQEVVARDEEELDSEELTKKQPRPSIHALLSRSACAGAVLPCKSLLAEEHVPGV